MVPVAPESFPVQCFPALIKALHTRLAASHVVGQVENNAEAESVCAVQVYGLPTLMVFKDGKKMDGSHKEGAMPKKMIEQYMSKLGLSPAAVS